MTAPVGMLRCVVAGGGAVGMMFADHLAASGHQVRVVDIAADPDPGPGSDRDPGRVRFARGDIANIGTELAADIGRADLVMLAVAEPVALASVAGVVAAMAPGALLVDTLSVKAGVVAAVEAAAPGRQMVSLNPMFAPALGLTGRPVAAVVVHDGPRVRQLLGLIGAWGGQVVTVSADEHDRLTSATQALTHATVLAFGLALAGLELGIGELGAIAPPPHLVQLALLARLCGGTPAVYWDVQFANPRAGSARTALADAARRLAAIIDDGDEAGFTALLERLRDFLGPDIGRYRDLCSRTFELTTHV